MNFEDTLLEFKKQYKHLEKAGLRIHGVGHLIGDCYVISISTPFIFDRRKLPQKFMGLDLRDGTSEVEMPIEFQNIDREKEYIWAYQRFENYVDVHSHLIRKTFGDLEMSRQDMLDALCFGDFESHKKLCMQWEKEGKIPKWENR